MIITHYYTIITSLVHFIMSSLLPYYVLLHHYYIVIAYYYRNNESINMYYCHYCRKLPVIMSPLLRIITRSIIRNNGFIITYYRPGQLGDATRAGRRRPTSDRHCPDMHCLDYQRRLVVRRASGCQPVGPRLLAVPGSCYHDHLQGHQVVISDTAKEFSTMLQKESSDQIAPKMCTKLFPKIGRYGQHKIKLLCIDHMNKK